MDFDWRWQVDLISFIPSFFLSFLSELNLRQINLIGHDICYEKENGLFLPALTLLWWLPISILPPHLWITAQSCAISKSSPLSTIYSLLLWTHAFLFFLMVCNSRLYLIFWPSNSPRFGHGTTTSRLLRFCDMLSSLSEQIISVLIQTQSHQPAPNPIFVLFC